MNIDIRILHIRIRIYAIMDDILSVHVYNQIHSISECVSFEHQLSLAKLIITISYYRYQVK